MAKSKNPIGRTERILSVYHLLKFCDEVETKELTQLMPGISEKTFHRDIALLQSAGVRVKSISRPYFGASVRAYVLFSRDRNPPTYPENKAVVRQIDKLLRLIRLTEEIPGEDCDIWYKMTFPGESKRTMERDFAVLNALGYKVHYKRGWDDLWEPEDQDPPGHYYCTGEDVYNTYGLDTFGWRGE